MLIHFWKLTENLSKNGECREKPGQYKEKREKLSINYLGKTGKGSGKTLKRDGFLSRLPFDDLVDLDLEIILRD